jgi:hypothetical protein
MCTPREKKLEEKNSKLQQELSLSRKENKLLKSKLSTSERKRKKLMADRDKKKPILAAYHCNLLNDTSFLNLSYR